MVAKHGSVITEAALHDMPYADGVVRETLRITPIVVGFSRVALQVGGCQGVHCNNACWLPVYTSCSASAPLSADVTTPLLARRTLSCAGTQCRLALA